MSTNTSTVTVPLTSKAHRQAQFAVSGITDAQQIRQIYLNKLSAYAVDQYLNLLGFETAQDLSDSQDTLIAQVLDIADVYIQNIGRIECRPWLKDAPHVDIPIEAQHDRVAHVMVQLTDSLQEAEILGFLPAPLNRVKRADIQPIENLLDLLADLEEKAQISLNSTQASSPQVHTLRDWLTHSTSEVINGWQQLQAVFEPKPQLAYQLLDAEQVLQTQRAKVFNLGTKLQHNAMIVILSLAPAENGKLTIQVRVQPEPAHTTLPAGLTLSLLDMEGQKLQTVEARFHDEWIQLPRFRGEVGERFQLQVCLADSDHPESVMTEVFEL